MKNNYLLLVGIWMLLTTLLVCSTNPVGQSNVDPSKNVVDTSKTVVVDTSNVVDTTNDNLLTYFPLTPGNEWIFRRFRKESIRDIFTIGGGTTRKNYYGIYRFTVSDNGMIRCEAVDSIYAVDSLTEAETLIEVKDTTYSKSMPISAAEIKPNTTYASYFFGTLFGVYYDIMTTVTTTVNDSLQFLKYFEDLGSSGEWTNIYLRNVGPVYIYAGSGSRSSMYGGNSREFLYLISFNGVPYNGEEIARQVKEIIDG